MTRDQPISVAETEAYVYDSCFNQIAYMTVAIRDLWEKRAEQEERIDRLLTALGEVEG